MQLPVDVSKKTTRKALCVRLPREICPIHAYVLWHGVEQATTALLKLWPRKYSPVRLGLACETRRGRRQLVISWMTRWTRRTDSWRVRQALFGWSRTHNAGGVTHARKNPCFYTAEHSLMHVLSSQQRERQPGSHRCAETRLLSRRGPAR